MQTLNIAADVCQVVVPYEAKDPGDIHRRRRHHQWRAS